MKSKKKQKPKISTPKDKSKKFYFIYKNIGEFLAMKL